MSSRFYLPLRHDKVAKTFLYSHIKTYSPDKKITLTNELEYIFIYRNALRLLVECINKNTVTKVPHNERGLIIWNCETKVCTMVEFSCPLDISNIKKVSEKLAVYALLVRNLQIMQFDYKFEIALIAVGAMGYVSKCLVFYLKMVGFKRKKKSNG